MKFDIGIDNPPFSGKTHHKFLEKTKKVSDITVFVQPSDWVFEDKFNDLRKNVEKITLINGNGPMNIGSFRPLSVSVFNRGKEKVLVDDKLNGREYRVNKNRINPFADETFWSVKRKVENQLDETLADYIDSTNGKYCIGIAKIRGNVNTTNESFSEPIVSRDFYSFLPNYSFDKLLERGEVGYSFRFDKKSRAKNFTKYLKTKFARFCLAITKRDQNLNQKKFSKVPWLNYDLKWDDYKLKKKFGLTDEEIVFIQENIDDFYD